MKTTLFSTVGAIALSGLCLTLTPSTLSAHGSSRGGHSSGHSSRGSHGSHGSRSCSHRGGHGRTCSHLPHGCRGANYHGHRCWYGGGHYWGVGADGGYEILDDSPEVDTTVAVADDTDDTAEVSVLPADCETVYVGGERCWYHDGCYYHRSGHGFCRTRCHDRGHGRTCGTRGRGNRGGRSCSRGSHGGGRSGGHSGGHGRR